MHIEELQAQDLLTLMPSTKDQITSFADNIKMQILDGVFDWRKFLLQKSFIEKSLETIFKDAEVKEYIESEIEKNGKEVGYGDAKFEVSGRKTWNYSQTGDSTIENLESEKKAIDEKIKARQKFLQTIPESGVADTESGEIIYRAAFSSITFVKTTIK